MPDTPQSPAAVSNSLPAAASDRPVLVWHPVRDEPHVKADADEAARFLGVPLAEVLAAIAGGDLLGGWFVDWASPSQWQPRAARAK